VVRTALSHGLEVMGIRRGYAGLIDGEILGNEAQGRCEVQEAGKSDVDLLDAYSRAVIHVAEAVGPAVVGISIGKETAEEAFTKTGAGSGVVIAPDGYILTNDHVVHQADQLTATLADGSKLTASLVGTDPGTDLALIRAVASNLPMRLWEILLCCGWDNW
jgi:S1-C subfamily serine protease